MDDSSIFPRRHTTPTHLGLPDKLLFGLTARQLLLLLLGGSLSYSFWLRLGVFLPPSWLLVRLISALPPVLLSFLVAFVTLHNRPLELWALVGLCYLLLPKTAVWRRLASSSQSGKSSKHASVQRLVPLRDIFHDVACLAPSTLDSQPSTRLYTAVLEVQSTNYVLLSPEEQQRLIDGYRSFLLALRFPIQILVRSQRMDLTPYVQRLTDAVNQPASAIEQQGSPPSASEDKQVLPKQQGHFPDRTTLAAAHRHAIVTLQQQRTLLDRRFYLVVRASEELHLPWYGMLPLIGSVLTKTHRQEQLSQAQRELDQRVMALTEHLSGIGLASRRLSGKALADLLDQSMRGEAALRFPLSESLFEQATEPALSAINGNEEDKGNTRQPALSQENPASGRSDDLDDDDEWEEMDEMEEEAHGEDRIKNLSLHDLLAPSCLMVVPDHVRVGEEYVRGIAVVGLPREIVDGALSNLLHLDEIMEITWHLHPQPTPALLRRLLREQAQYRSTQRINERRGSNQDPDLTVAQADAERLLPALASGQERLIDVGFYVAARARSAEEVQAHSQRILSTLHNSLLSAHPTTLEHLETFQALQPTGQDPLGRTITTTSTALAALMPFLSEAVSMPSGVFLGVTPGGEPILLDPWGPGMDNPHEFWGGISGAGKSFAIKLRIMHELLVHPDLQVVVIDPAGEYQNMTEAMGGHSIRIAPGSAQSINPFDLVPPGLDLSRYVQLQQGDRLAEKIQNLHSFLDILLADYTPTPGTLKSEEKSLLDKVLYEVYARAGITADPWTHGRPAPLLQDVALVLRQDKKNKDALRLADRLQRFITGSMAGLFSRPTNVALDVPLLTFDLREMRGGSEIKPAGIFLISEFLWTQALYHPKPRRCYIDEAWSLIRHQEGGVFLERMAREFRKHAVSVVTITQNPEQFVTDPHGSVIAQNAYTKVLKRLDTIGSRAARTAFGLSQTEEQRLTTLDQKKALFLIGSKRLIVEITASPEEYILAHTDPGTQPPSLSVQAEPATSQAISTRTPRTRGKRNATRSVAAPQDPDSSSSPATDADSTAERTGDKNV
ncbi:hypothetical protein KSF_066760 [Reticulibacter mediterranei]|uniref:Helicase HerA central domain-containing protein n=1 Tax=Reticulibacter mediterranei TaxID=2778369 RepID=A0A8J3IQ87_9CHLR|nr:PrgI family protein [Reticulibacter mediterranei]GHO96628.1 hypothetical protein KSF_066760 [Reticulibacter mediterranei]